jgi:hypothetical protein
VTLYNLLPTAAQQHCPVAARVFHYHCIHVNLMLRRDPTPLALNEFDVEDVKKAMTKMWETHRSGSQQQAAAPEDPVNALEQARKKKEGKSTAQRIGLTQ